MAREAARAQRRAEAERRRQFREQSRTLRLTQRNAAIAIKQAKQQHVERRTQEVEELNLQLSERLDELRSILPHITDVALGRIFESMRIRTPFPPFSPPANLTVWQPAPVRQNFLQKVKPLSWFARLSRSRIESHKVAIEAAIAEYEKAIVAYKASEDHRKDQLLATQAEHERTLIAYEEKVRDQDNQVDAFIAGYRSHDPEAVVSVVGLVIDHSLYPDGFPHQYECAYVPESKHLVVEYELPPPSIVPEVQEYKYIRSKDAITQKPARAATRNEIYRDVVAAIALRTLQELFVSDEAKALQVLTFNGYAHTVDPATGHDIKPHFISVRVTAEQFQQLDLERIDKAVCLRNLGAQVSPNPCEIQPVKPIVDFNMVDKRFVEQIDVLTSLESRPNLMDLTPSEFENLVANLFGKMAIEAKLTRTHRDGGVDVVGYDTRPILGGKVVIQAKRYRHTVGVSAVRDLFGTMQHEGANKGILVTTSGYGPDAFSFAQDKPIELIDGAALLYLLDQNGTPARIIFPQEQT